MVIMKKEIRMSILIPLVGYLVFCLSSCAPVFSDLQSARMLDQGNIEFTPSLSRIGFSAEGESEGVQTHLGVQFGVGLIDELDLRARIEYITVDDIDFNASVIGIGPKVALFKDYIAGYVPIGFAFIEDIETSDTWEIHPTLLFTLPVADIFEVNPSLKWLIRLQTDSENFLAFNLGFGIGKYGIFVARPEFGFLVNPGETGLFYHFSLGLSAYPFWKE